jgi:hypothetical protein
LDDDLMTDGGGLAGGFDGDFLHRCIPVVCGNPFTPHVSRLVLKIAPS